MAFRNASRVDASRSTFNDVGRDQSIYNLYFINGFPESLGRILPDHDGQHISRCDVLPRPAPRLGALSQGAALVPSPTSTSHPSELVSVIDLAANLIDKIVELISSNSQHSHRYQDLRLELESLHSAFCLTRFAVQVFKHTSLDRRLTSTICPEVGRCFVVLRGMFDKISYYRRSLSLTPVNYLWPVVCWSGWDKDELVELRQELSMHRTALDEFLMALNS